jgi:hypothetical protein
MRDWGLICVYIPNHTYKYAGMFGELVMKLLDERPHLLLHDIVRG